MSTKIEIKSAEQKLIEQHTKDYAKKLQFALGSMGVKVNVQIEGVPQKKLTDIAHFLKDEEDVPAKLHVGDMVHNEGQLSIKHRINGEGFCIESIASEF